ncbi:hypothetical protein PASE110613_09790 [Paenibacillus sediminis]|uniref:DUF3813 domain-containing protein n=1 Tax=Paenibacillus sediminis TaxID=664909 RepID=A0ABS4H5G6_9BACL|nr:hypothetical protein [Paenibacillus sediminis]MBP1937778.1 hypothetical protein [Paenibacillus sediminis]
MSRYDSSLQSQNPFSQAQHSVEKLHRAVSSAMSHPTDQTVNQAYSRLEHTEVSVRQAEDSRNHQPVELAEEMLAEEKERLAEASASLEKKNQSE